MARTTCKLAGSPPSPQNLVACETQVLKAGEVQVKSKLSCTCPELRAEVSCLNRLVDTSDLQIEISLEYENVSQHVSSYRHEGLGSLLKLHPPADPMTLFLRSR